MASEESIKKMIHAIMDKRKKLGIPDWGQVPIGDVIERLNRSDQQDKSTKEPCEESDREPK